jgi:hypothetical protein
VEACARSSVASTWIYWLLTLGPISWLLLYKIDGPFIINSSTSKKDMDAIVGGKPKGIFARHQHQHQ